MGSPGELVGKSAVAAAAELGLAAALAVAECAGAAERAERLEEADVDRCMTGTGGGGGGLTTPSSPSSSADDRVDAAPSSPSPSADPLVVAAPEAPSAPSPPPPLLLLLLSVFAAAAPVSVAVSCVFATSVAAERFSSAIAAAGCDRGWARGCGCCRTSAPTESEQEGRERDASQSMVSVWIDG